MESVNPKGDLKGSKSECTITDAVFVPISRLSNLPFSLNSYNILQYAGYLLLHTISWPMPSTLSLVELVPSISTPIYANK